MLRKFLDWQLSLATKGQPLEKVRPLVTAGDTFLYEPAETTKFGPHIRGAVDLKRWMVLVVVALLPCIIMAIWNTGVQKYVYTSSDFRLMNAYLEASSSFAGYFKFCFSEGRWLTILGLGAAAYIPVMLISYIVGGFWEALFAVIRRHDVAEGFLVTGMLYALILPPTIPYWMVAVGVSLGVVLGKELFGGTGMNIVNPAMICRAFLFFTFPAAMTGPVWVGTNPTVVVQSLKVMNADANRPAWDGYTQATPLGVFNVGDEVKRIHVEAIATNTVGLDLPLIAPIKAQFGRWNSDQQQAATAVAGPPQLGQLTGDQLRSFVTDPLDKGGLGLPGDSYEQAWRFSQLRYDLNPQTNGNFFWGNRLGSMGSTSILACLIGALFLVWMGIGSWRTMVSVIIGAYVMALVFNLIGNFIGIDSGAWNGARFAFPAYKHLLLGGLAFGLVFMATDPVSSPTLNGAKWIYGLAIGAITVIIRVVNPAYPEGVMLAILFMNVFAPLIDHLVAKRYRKVEYVTS